MEKLTTDLQAISKELKDVTKDTEILMKAVLRNLRTISKKTEKAVKTAHKLEEAMEGKPFKAKSKKKKPARKTSVER
jgi:hypothetical protein